MKAITCIGRRVVTHLVRSLGSMIAFPKRLTLNTMLAVSLLFTYQCAAAGSIQDPSGNTLHDFAAAPLVAQAMRLPADKRFFLEYLADDSVLHVALESTEKQQPIVIVDDLSHPKFFDRSAFFKAASPYNIKYEINRVLFFFR